MEELDSASQLIYNNIEFYWALVINYVGAPDIKIDGATFDVYGYQEWRRDKDHPFTRLELIPNGGQVVVLIGQWYEEADVQQQGGAGQGGANTAVRELDSGPVAVAIGVNPVQLIAANNARVRGVTVQNVGTTVVAVSKDPALRQDLTKAAYLLNADSAVNAGNGGAVLFDGWQGPVYGVNVAGGPGSVIVSAF